MNILGIIGAMEEEIACLLQSMDHIRENRHAHMTFYEGLIQQQRVVLVLSGIGKVNASMATVVLIEVYEVAAIINTGSAGALKDDMDIGDVVISTQLAYHDVDATAFDYALGQVPQLPLYYRASEEINKKIEEAIHKVGGRAKFGEIVTSDSFIADPLKIASIKQSFPEAAVTEMEGAAIAQVCFQYQLPFTVIRAISDKSKSDAALSFDEFLTVAGKRSAQMIIEFIKLEGINF